MAPTGLSGDRRRRPCDVATANRLTAPLLKGHVGDDDLAAVERRRLFPTRATQWAQVTAQNNIVARALNQAAPLRPPLAFRLIGRFAFLRRLMARLVGMGVRPEHVGGAPQ